MTLYIHKNGQQFGPFEEDQVLTGLRDGMWSPNDAAWREGMADWQLLGSLYPPAPFTHPSPPPPMYPPLPQSLDANSALRFILPIGRSGWAIAAGYLGLFSFIILPAPLSLIISIIAILDIQKSKLSGQPKLGMGRAIFGLIMGLLGTAILLFAVLSSLVR